MEKIKASVGILTKNSGKTIRRALESVQDFDDIIICDGGSFDDTLAIAREFGTRLIPQNIQFLRTDGRIKDYAGVRNQCLDAAQHDWFLYIDSDETISDGLRDEIRDAIHYDRKNLAYRVPIKIVMDGRVIEYSSNYPGYQYRFFNRKSGARFVKPVHERVDIDPREVPVGTFKNPWHTHTTREYWRHFLRHSAYYRPLEVDLFCKAPFSAYLRYIVWRNIRTSLGVLVRATKNYLRHGFKDSMPISGEWARVMIPLALAWDVTLCKLRLK
jgi:glycosyltransferase involved in cell wall biosynthesis